MVPKLALLGPAFMPGKRNAIYSFPFPFLAAEGGKEGEGGCCFILLTRHGWPIRPVILSEAKNLDRRVGTNAERFFASLRYAQNDVLVPHLGRLGGRPLLSHTP